MPNFLALGDLLAQCILYLLPRRISSRIQQNVSPTTTYVLRTNTTKYAQNDRNDCNTNDGGEGEQLEPRMTLFEGVFATILFDLALFGTSNMFINGIISLFTSFQNSWDKPFQSKEEAEEKITQFCEKLGIQMIPWIWEKGIGEYKSLNDFFSRTYGEGNFPKIGDGKEGADGVVVSPACCKLTSYENDTSLKSILIKGCEYEINRVGLPKGKEGKDDGDLAKYAKNRVFLGYLSPKDYHRVHAPITGKCVHCKMEGEGFPSASVKFFGGKFNLLNDNKRLVVVFEQQCNKEANGTSTRTHASNGTNGSNGKSVEPLRVALVIVGGVGVNTITYNPQMVGQMFDKGQEVSAFRAGGSAIALFSTKPLNVLPPILEASKKSMQVDALVGETLAYY